MNINKYPYTDFHELNLDWFLAQFKTLTDAWDVQKVDYNKFKEDVTTEFNNLSGKFDTLEETVQSFTRFITNYFDNLDVQEEINTKLDELVADGTMTELIRPIFDAYAAQMTQRMNVLEGRMDTFASLPEGSTSGNAELLDIRVGGNGVTYPSAGNAVRAQYGINHSDINNVYDFLGDAYEWLDGYYSIGQGIWTPQTGNVSYHSTNKITGKIPDLSDFVNSDYMSGDSFFPIWLGTTYKGYLMDGVWHNPNGSIPSVTLDYDNYAIVLHNVTDYQNFRLRNVALKSENDNVKTTADKALAEGDLLVDTKEITNETNAQLTTNNSYGYKLLKKVYMKSYTTTIESGYVSVYILKENTDNTYSTVKSKKLYPGDSFEINETLDTSNAILLTFLGRDPITQDFATVNNDTFSKCYLWNANTSKLIASSNNYYIPGSYVVYDPITNYLLNYIDDGDPCNWKGTECSVFDNLLCIGDSITQGAPTPPDITPDPSKATRTVNNQIMYSYPSSMKKQWGVECTNWGRSGSTSQGWYDYYSSNEPSWSGHDGAIMLIGNNDYHLVDDLGGLTEETLPIASQRSKAAMMSIITKLKADNADIKIFICTLLPGWDIGTSLSPLVIQNIKDIAATEDNVYLIDLSKYSKIKGAYMYGHPTAIGYNQLAREIGGAIGYTIINNPDEFKWIQFIGTEYAMDGQ